VNENQTNAVNQLINSMKVLRGLDATLRSEREFGNYVYFQLDVPTPRRFPELRVSDRGTLWSDGLCNGGEVKSFPTSSDLPYHVSLAYADECVAGIRRGTEGDWNDVRIAYRVPAHP